MKNQQLKFSLLAITLIAASSCGGGGGGGGDGGDSGRSASTGARVLHAAIDAVPVDLLSSADPGSIVQRSAFGDTTHYAGLRQGAQHLSLVAARVGGAELFGTNIEVLKKSRKSVLLFGNGTSIGLHAAIIEDDAQEVPESGHCLLRVVHALVGANQLEVGSTAGPNFNPVTFGSASGYEPCVPGPITLNATRGVDGRSVAAITTTLEDRSISTVLFGGEIDYFTIVRLFDDR